jgi:hypothetical protein
MMWIDQLSDQLAAYLACYNTGVLSAAGAAPLPVRYRSRHLIVECLVPRWADLAYVVSEQPTMVLIVPAPADVARWLQYQGQAQIATAPDWSGWLPAGAAQQQAHAHYLVVELQPQRLDLFDQRRGWGARETLDLAVDRPARSDDV